VDPRKTEGRQTPKPQPAPFEIDETLAVNAPAGAKDVPTARPPLDTAPTSTDSTIQSATNAGAATTIAGTVIGDRYEVISRLGSGGMSVVYKAHHKLMDKIVAIKMLHPGLTGDPETVERFRQEAQAESFLNHPHIIAAQSLGVTDEGGLYLVMDFLPGMSLADLLNIAGRLDQKRALNIFIQTAEALAHAHEKGVIHRDIKPSNIMLIDNEENADFVKVVDFGIAKILPADGRRHQQLTADGTIFGTPAYMSPEQCLGQIPDHRSDLYALGCLMYEVVSGKVPFKGETPIETMLRHVNETAPAIADDVQIGSKLESIIYKLLEKEPARRYQQSGELLDDLREALETVDQPQVRITTSRDKISATQAKLAQIPRRKKALFGIGATVLLVMAVLLANGSTLLAAGQLAMFEPKLKADAEIAAGKDDYFNNFRLKEELAGLYWSAGRRDDAKPVYDSLARFWFASNFFFTKNLDAVDLYARVFERAYADDPVRLSDAYRKAGRMLERQFNSTDAAKAEYFYARNVDFARANWTSGLPLALADFAQIKMRRGDFVAAEDLLKRAQQALEDPSVKNNIDLRRVINIQLADCLIKLNKLGAANETLEGVTAISPNPVLEWRAVPAMRQLADKLAAEGDAAGAEKWYRHILEIQNSVTLKPTVQIADTLYNLALVYFNEKRNEDAEKTLRVALAFKLPPRSHRDLLMNINHLLADIYLAQSRLPQAERLYAEELAALKEQKHPNLSSTHQITVKKLASVINWQGRSAEASKLLVSYGLPADDVYGQLGKTK
jgi:tetratricopeptide (TPR) repeat protein